MKKSLKLITAVFLFLLAACATNGSSPNRDKIAKSQELEIEYPGFLSLTADDLNRLDAATRKGAANAEILLSEGRIAACSKQSCECLGAKNGVTGTLERENLEEIRYLWNESVSKGKPSTVINGPVTIRCTPERCNGDLYYRSQRPIEIREKGKVVQEGDPTGYFLTSFVQAIVKSGRGRN